MSILKAFAFLTAALICIGQAASASDQLQRLSDNVVPLRYDLDLDINPRGDEFSGIASIKVRLLQETSIFRLHGRGLKVEAASIKLGDGQTVAATYSENTKTGDAEIRPARSVAPGEVILVLRYSAVFRKALSGLYKAKRSGASYAYTQFQPLRARPRVSKF